MTAPGSRTARKAHPRLFWSGIFLLVLAVLAAGIGDGYVEYRNGEIHHITVGHLNASPSAGVDANTENILLIGSTSRCVLNNKQTGAFGSCAAGVTGVNSDVVMVLRVDPNRHRVAILSLPRDTFLPNARPGEYNRVDSALAYGPSQLVLAVEQDLGISIQHFVELNFDSFQNVVQALGGLDMWFPYPVKDAQSGLNVPIAGCVHLNGFAALAVVRARHMYYKVHGQWLYDGSGDLGRIERDHEFLRVLAAAVAKRGLSNPGTDNALIGAVAPQLTVDASFGPSAMVDLILAVHHVNPYRVLETTLPIMVDPTYDYQYKGYDYGNIVFPTEPQDLAAVTKFLGHAPVGTKLAASAVTVSVLGGIGDPAATARTAAQLRALGFRVVGTAEQTPVGPVSEASVIYGGHPKLADGQRVLSSLSGAVALGQGATLDGADVTVVTGSNFSVDAPLTHPTTVAWRPVSMQLPATLLHEVLTSGPAVPAPVLAPPTSASQPLPRYDPRACPSGA